MNYAILDADGFVIQVMIYAADQYAELDAAAKQQIMGCPDDIVVGCQLQPNDGWLYPNDILDAQFTASPSIYKEAKCSLLDTQFNVILANGFTYTDGKRYKGDVRSQLWAIGFMFSVVQGLMTPPINWISADNSVTQFPTSQAFAAFISFFLNWGQQVTFANFTAKMQIRTQTTRAAVDTIYNNYLASMAI